MKKINLISATVRPDMFIKNYKKWMDNASGMNEIITTIAVNTEDQKEKILNFYPEINIIVIGDENIGVCKPLYAVTKSLVGDYEDLIIGFFDDVDCIPEWDLFIETLFMSYSGAVVLNDGLTPIDVKIITMPIMDFETLQILNKAIYHPDYMHYYADNEVYHNLEELGLLKDLKNVYKEIIFRHNHYYGAKAKRPCDSVDGEIIRRCGSPDREVFNRRMSMTIEERLKVNE